MAQQQILDIMAELTRQQGQQQTVAGQLATALERLAVAQENNNILTSQGQGRAEALMERSAQANEAAAQVAKEDYEQRMRRGDKSGKGPTMFVHEKDWAGWSFQMEVHFGTMSRNAERFMKEARDSGATEIDTAWVTSRGDECQRLSNSLFHGIANLVQPSTEQMSILKNAARGNGLDVWRRFCHRYEPVNPQSNATMLKKLLATR